MSRPSAFASGAVVITLLACGQGRADEARRLFSIDAQPLPSALLVFAQQAGVELVAPSASLQALSARSVHGSFARREALALLLAGTGFEGRLEGASLRLDRVTEEVSAAPAAPSPLTSEDIVVVGTTIRGHYPRPYPVEIFNARDIERSGAATSEQFIATLTQNLGSRTQFAPGATAAANLEAVNGVDLRGLGVGTSLVLMNGRRLPLAADGRTVDLSFLPLSVVGRAEVLTDGASAIYGADAVGGVVNFVLRSDLDGAEANLDFGSVTDGGLEDGGGSLVLGRHWSGGASMLAFSARAASALERQDRPYARGAGEGDLSPSDRRASLLGNLSLDLGGGYDLSAWALIAHREVESTFEVGDSGALETNRTDALSQVLSVAVAHDVGRDLHATITGGFGRNISRGDRVVDQASGSRRFSLDQDYSNFDLSAELSGLAWRTPAGAARFSLGAGRTLERFSSALSTARFGRTMSYGFGELALPLFGPRSAAAEADPNATRVELSLATRYSAYEDDSRPPLGLSIGERWSSKLGLSYSPNASLTVRGSLSQSFRAPSYSWVELDPALRFTELLPVSVGGEPRLVLGVFGSGPIEAETALTKTLGVDVNWPWSHLRLRATYYEVAYDHRVSLPDPTFGAEAFADPSAYGGILYRPDSAATIASLLGAGPNIFNASGVELSNPAAAAQTLAARSDLVVFDNRIRSNGAVTLRGLDLDFSGAMEAGEARLWFAGRASAMFAYDEQLFAGGPVEHALGWVLYPAKLRSRIAVGLERGAWDAMLALNYLSAFDNPYGLTRRTVADWLTFDARIGWRFGGDGGERRSVLALEAHNLFDRSPPYVETSGLAGLALRSPVGFDPANADPVGRFIGLTLSRRW